MIRRLCTLLLVVSAIPALAQTASPQANAPGLDVAYGAYERGFYVTAFNEASARAKPWRHKKVTADKWNQ